MKVGSKVRRRKRTTRSYCQQWKAPCNGNAGPERVDIGTSRPRIRRREAAEFRVVGFAQSASYLGLEYRTNLASQLMQARIPARLYPDRRRIQ